jgi:hypothetical protein
VVADLQISIHSPLADLVFLFDYPASGMTTIL